MTMSLFESSCTNSDDSASSTSRLHVVKYPLLLPSGNRINSDSPSAMSLVNGAVSPVNERDRISANRTTWFTTSDDILIHPFIQQPKIARQPSRKNLVYVVSGNDWDCAIGYNYYRTRLQTWSDGNGGITHLVAESKHKFGIFGEIFSADNGIRFTSWSSTPKEAIFDRLIRKRERGWSINILVFSSDVVVQPAWMVEMARNNDLNLFLVYYDD